MPCIITEYKKAHLKNTSPNTFNYSAAAPNCFTFDPSLPCVSFEQGAFWSRFCVYPIFFFLFIVFFGLILCCMVSQMLCLWIENVVIFNMAHLIRICFLGLMLVWVDSVITWCCCHMSVMQLIWFLVHFLLINMPIWV